MTDRATDARRGFEVAGDMARRFLGHGGIFMKQFRLAIGNLMLDIRENQWAVADSLARRAERQAAGIPGKYDLLPPPELTWDEARVRKEVDRLANNAGLGPSYFDDTMVIVAVAIVMTIVDSKPGELEDEDEVLKALGVQPVTVTKTSDPVKPGTAGWLDEDTGRDIRQDRDDLNIVVATNVTEREPRQERRLPDEVSVVRRVDGVAEWTLVPVYVIATQTGKVTIKEAIPIPKRNDKDDAIRWYVPDLGKEIANKYDATGYVAFEHLNDAIDYLTEWTNRSRRQIQEAYKWMSSQVARDRRDQRQ